MSSREPLWYCHECNAEMRPLMVPDPVCASCHGSFVEKMENPTDDPREFHRQAGPDIGGDGEGIPLGLETFLLALQGLAVNPEAAQPRRSPERPTGPTVTRTVEFRSGSGPTSRTIRFGGPGALGPEDPDQPTMSDFLQRPPGDGTGAITGPIMARYLMALLGREHLSDVFARGMGEGPAAGRMGDYVFNQEGTLISRYLTIPFKCPQALDQIITQLMENSNTGRPVPATEEIIENLPREVLEVGSATLEKDCAVCKDQFKLDTEDPDEQVVVTLPCKHPFHEPCILPWLKSSGTCPVCRHALIPQPEHHGPPPAADGGSGPRPDSRRSPPSPNAGPGGNLFQSLFGYTGAGGSGGQTGSGGGTSRPRSNSDTTGQSSDHVPGSWNDELD
ncbi:hypothetical protein C8R46DRAFT_1350073 [Mycena filopes]|nr:hypothetical protein C8R46DRAFT_1350073 [Mycena filopes]